LTRKPHIQLEALHALARALAEGEFRARTVLERACSAVADGFAFERVGIVRYVTANRALIPFVAHGLTAAEQEALPAALPIDRFSAFQRALTTGTATFVADPSDEQALPERIARDFGIGSFVLVPLISEGRCLGFMTCDERGEAFSLEPAEIHLLDTFGALIAAFFERAIQHAELRRLNELRSQFIALASHELRTPASAIYGAVQTLDAREDDLPAEHRAELRRMLSRQSKRLVELVDNLLDLSRIEADSLRIEPTEIEVRERLQEIADAVVDRDHTVTVDVAENLRAVVDPRAFDRIVSNLVANAARHGKPPIVISAHQGRDELCVTVDDQGPGVPPEFMSSIFERFTRGERASTEGAGLGLAIAQSYARAHGGTITYEPGVPHGARFCITFPGWESPTDPVSSEHDEAAVEAAADGSPAGPPTG
jgi:signal transduction histidine kinase